MVINCLCRKKQASRNFSIGLACVQKFQDLQLPPGQASRVGQGGGPRAARWRCGLGRQKILAHTRSHGGRAQMIENCERLLHSLCVPPKQSKRLGISGADPFPLGCGSAPIAFKGEAVDAMGSFWNCDVSLRLQELLPCQGVIPPFLMG